MSTEHSHNPHVMKVAKGTSIANSVAKQFELVAPMQLKSLNNANWFASPQGVMLGVADHRQEDGSAYLSVGQIYSVLLRNKLEAEFNPKIATSVAPEDAEVYATQSYRGYSAGNGLFVVEKETAVWR